MNRQRCFFLVIIVLLNGFSSKAQADSILNLKDANQRLKAFRDWAYYNIYWESKETRDKRPGTFSILDKIYKKAIEKKDRKIEREAWFNIELWKMGGVVATFKPKDSTVNSILKAAEIARERGWDYTEAECYMAASSIYFYNGNFKQAFDQSNQAFRIIEKIGLDQYPEANVHLAEIANHYFHFFEYDSAISLTQRALRVPEPWTDIPKLYSVVNTLAWAFEESGKFDSAAYWYRKSIDYADQANEVFWHSLVTGSLGGLYFNLGKDSLAFPLLQYDFNSSVAAGYYNVAARAAGPLAAYYIRKKNIDSAQKYERFFRQYLNKENEYGKVMLYKNLGAIYRYQQNYQKAYLYLDSADYFFNKDQKVHDFSILSRSKLLGDMEVYGERVKTIEAMQANDAVIKNMMLIIVVLGGISVLMLFNRFRIVKNIQLKTAVVEKKLITEELKHASAELDAFSRVIKEKNELIDHFRESFEKIRLPHAIDFNQEAVLKEINDLNILTEDDWRHFKELFDKVNPGFLIRVREKYTDLTAADIRLITLTKLKINPKEMAAMLGVGQDAIRKSRLRARSKMGLGKNDSFDEIIHSI